jgi:hypothetical protein
MQHLVVSRLDFTHRPLNEATLESRKADKTTNYILPVGPITTADAFGASLRMSSEDVVAMIMTTAHSMHEYVFPSDWCLSRHPS